MRLTGFDVLDASIQATNTWFNELTQELNWVDRRKATYGEISDLQGGTRATYRPLARHLACCVKCSSDSNALYGSGWWHGSSQVSTRSRTRHPRRIGSRRRQLRR